MTRPPDLLLRGTTVVTMNARREVLDPGLVAISGGRIASVAPDTGESMEAAKVRNLPDRVVLPGFVNTHAHLVSSLTRGLGGDRFQTGPDSERRRMAAAIREHLDEETSHAGARLALTELLNSGVTTTTDSQAARRGLEDAADGTLRALTESGIRAVWYRASVDRTEIVPSHRHDTAELALSELTRLRRRWGSDRVEIGAEAMALHRVSQALLESLAGWAADNRAPMAMHIAYSESAAAHAVDTYGTSLMLLLAKWGILGPRFLGYHPVHLDPAEMEAVNKADAGLAVCSGANMLIGLHPAPLPQLLAMGLRIGLGTDQPNDGHDFFATMKNTVLQQRAAATSTEFGSPELMLELATIGGARALHLEHEIGSLEPGKRADVVVLDARRPALNPAPGRLSNVVYAAGPGEVETVLVNGEEVFAGGRPVAWEPEEVVDGVNRLVADVTEWEQRSTSRDGPN